VAWIQPVDIFLSKRLRRTLFNILPIYVGYSISRRYNEINPGVISNSLTREILGFDLGFLSTHLDASPTHTHTDQGLNNNIMGWISDLLK